MTEVSVVIPTWNRADVIVRSVSSALGQTMPDLQLVVVDNGSTDDTVDLVKALADRRVTIVHSPTNRGASGGRNAGLAVATGKYVGFLDSDDELDLRWAACLLGAVSEGAALATCGFAMIGSDGSVRYEHGSEQLGPSFSNMIGPFQAGNFVVERRLLQALGGYAESLRYSENTELGLRLAHHCVSSGRAMASVDLPLLRWHHNPSHVYDVPERRASCRFLLEHHRALLSRDPKMISSYSSQLAVWDARAGDLRSARKNFLAAWWVRPLGLRNLARLMIATLPPLARRSWPRSVSSVA